MSLITLLIALIIIGFIMWLVNYLIPMDPKVKTVVNVLFAVIILIVVIKALLGLPAIRL